MLRRLHHIGIAVGDLNAATELFARAFDLTPERREVVESEKVEAVVFRVGDVGIELISSSDTESPVARFLEQRGQGLHHLAFEVDDLESTVESVTQAGLAIIDGEARPGLSGTKVAFIHPRELFGVLAELVEDLEKPD